MADENRDRKGSEPTAPTTEVPAAKKKSSRGFASMSPERQREIARKGGKAAHEKGTAHEFTPDEARVAGRKGGETVSRDRKHMAEIGREGGQARGQRASERKKAQQEAAAKEPKASLAPVGTGAASGATGISGASGASGAPAGTGGPVLAPTPRPPTEELSGPSNVTRGDFGPMTHQPPRQPSPARETGT